MKKKTENLVEFSYRGMDDRFTTYWGRFRHFLNMINPVMFFITEK